VTFSKRGLPDCAIRRHAPESELRIRRLSAGNPGDVKPVGKGVSEMRIDYGPGYRIYSVQRGKTVVILLCGGDKRTQARDIARAVEVSQEI